MGETTGTIAAEGWGIDTHSLSEQIIGSLTSGVIAVDARGRILCSNPSACNYLGVSEVELTAGTSFKSVTQLFPFAPVLEEMEREGKPLSRREVVIGGGDEPRREIGVSASLLEGPDAYNGAILLFVDMTERRELERRADLNKQLVTLGELAAGVVHELRNPLTIISGRTQLLERRIAADDEKSRESLTAILEETERLERSISHFLGFAKPFALRPGPCSAEKIALRSLELCQHNADKKGVTLRANIPSTLEGMHIDFEKVSEALSNIVSNGVDAVGEGGTIELRAYQTGVMTHFEVLDDGPGIHLQPGEDLLSPFFTKKRDGTGLGLSIVQRIINAQGGAVRYGNRPEGGARFEVVVPTVQGRME